MCDLKLSDFRTLAPLFPPHSSSGGHHRSRKLVSGSLLKVCVCVKESDRSVALSKTRTGWCYSYGRGETGSARASTQTGLRARNTQRGKQVYQMGRGKRKTCLCMGYLLRCTWGQCTVLSFPRVCHDSCLYARAIGDVIGSA